MYVHVCAHVWMCVDTRVKRLPLSLAILIDEAKSLKEPGISNLARLVVQQAFGMSPAHIARVIGIHSSVLLLCECWGFQFRSS